MLADNAGIGIWERRRATSLEMALQKVFRFDQNFARDLRPTRLLPRIQLYRCR